MMYASFQKKLCLSEHCHDVLDIIYNDQLDLRPVEDNFRLSSNL